MSDEQNLDASTPAPRRIGIQANAAGFVEVHLQYQGLLTAFAMPAAEARDLAAHLVSYADMAEKAMAEAVAAREKEAADAIKSAKKYRRKKAA